MRFTIEQAMLTYSDATGVWIMCDGDISPFKIDGGLCGCGKNVCRPESKGSESCYSSYNETNWKAFCSRWANVRFHFIAFDLGADRIGMPMMAQEGCGSISQCTFSCWLPLAMPSMRVNVRIKCEENCRKTVYF